MTRDDFNRSTIICNAILEATERAEYPSPGYLDGGPGFSEAPANLSTIEPLPLVTEKVRMPDPALWENVG